MRALLGSAVAVVSVLAVGCSPGSSPTPSRGSSAPAVFAPPLRRTEALGSVTSDTSLDAYAADGSQLRGTAHTVVDFTSRRASGSVEIQPATDFMWWREGAGVFVQGFAVDIAGQTFSVSDADPSWSPTLPSRAAVFAPMRLLLGARGVGSSGNGRYAFTLPMRQADRALRTAIQLHSPNLGDAFAALSSRYTRATGTADISHGRIVRLELIVHGPHSRPSASITFGVSRLGRSDPEPSPGPLTSRQEA